LAYDFAPASLEQNLFGGRPIRSKFCGFGWNPMIDNQPGRPL
jgi:hypothetical protein